jgi:hypothetical protein
MWKSAKSTSSTPVEPVPALTQTRGFVMSLENPVQPLLKFGEHLAAHHVCVAADMDFQEMQADTQEKPLTLYQEIEFADK